MALSLSSPESPATPGFDRSQRLSSSSPKPAPLRNGVKTPDVTSNGSASQPKGLKQSASSTLLEIPKQSGIALPSSKTPSRSPKEKHEHNLPTIRMEGPSPTSNYSYSERTTIKEARNRRRKPWRKLMWVKQNYPDNYTDATFLDSLQRNVNFRAYDFWSLVYDSTVIIQHLSTVVIFVSAFIAISLGKVQPIYVAGASNVLTIIGWLIWDEWNEEEQLFLAKVQENMREESRRVLSDDSETTALDRESVLRKSSSSVTLRATAKTQGPKSNGTRLPPGSRSSSPSPKKSVRTSQHSRSLDFAATSSESETASAHLTYELQRSQTSPPNYSDIPPPSPPPAPSRTNRRLSTLKSALLIYSTLLGLSPILKSLTRTTTSDSIWALGSWLFLVNLLCFDYGLGEGEADLSKKGAEGIALGGVGPHGGGAFRKKFDPRSTMLLLLVNF
ncbi:hypothetical protein ABW19_dt0200273 [Dactylella cylindrospora]|nr:hypothetical protein ABW19_dt0200273 [Dactylella cylindrospora]